MDIKRARCIFLLVSLVSSYNAFSKTGQHGFIDFNAYPYLSDVDNDSVLTINSAYQYNNRFSYFSLTNFINSAESSEFGDIGSFYSEQNIRWKLAENSSFDATWQSNFRSGDRNDRHRLGVRWRVNDYEGLSNFFESINLKYSVNLHAIQFDHEAPHVWQLEHVFYLKLPSITEKLYIAGFIDHTFNQDLPRDIPKNPIVAEVQFGYEINQKLFIITEYRINEYRRSDVNNIAVGVQYKASW